MHVLHELLLFFREELLPNAIPERNVLEARRSVDAKHADLCVGSCQRTSCDGLEIDTPYVALVRRRPRGGRRLT